MSGTNRREPADEAVLRENRLVRAALELTAHADRLAFLTSACAGDSALLERLESRLAEPEGSAEPQPDSRAPSATVVGSVTEATGDRIGSFKLGEKVGEGGCDSLEKVDHRNAGTVTPHGATLASAVHSKQQLSAAELGRLAEDLVSGGQRLEPRSKARG